MRLEDSVLINCPRAQLYDLIKDVERHADLLPGYTESRIVERKTNSCIIQREAVMSGKSHRWKSEFWADEGQCMHFVQVEGPLTGMHVRWILEPVENTTRMSIIHDVRSRLPLWKRWWFKHYVAKPSIQRTARTVLDAIKLAAEGGSPS